MRDDGGPPDWFWPWGWVTYSLPARSFRETSDDWEQQRLDREPIGLMWLGIGAAIGLIALIAS